MGMLYLKMKEKCRIKRNAKIVLKVFLTKVCLKYQICAKNSCFNLTNLLKPVCWMTCYQQTFKKPAPNDKSHFLLDKKSTRRSRSADC